jgi:hypothetical protein
MKFLAEVTSKSTYSEPRSVGRQVQNMHIQQQITLRRPKGYVACHSILALSVANRKREDWEGLRLDHDRNPNRKRTLVNTFLTMVSSRALVRCRGATP